MFDDTFRVIAKVLLQQNGALKGLLQPHGPFLRPGLLGNAQPNKGQE
jgi:hypothetical protein